MPEPFRFASLLRHTEAYWVRYLCVLFCVIISVSLYLKTGHTLLGITCTLLYPLLILIAVLIKRTSYKYLLAVAAAVLTVFTLYYEGINYSSILTTVYYLPMLYAFLFTSRWLPILTGAGLALFSTLYLGRPGGDDGYVQGNIIGIVFVTLIATMFAHLIDRLTRERNQYQAMSTTDSLTGLASLDHTLKVGTQWLSDGLALHVFVIDLNRFKQINDTYGHMVGNDVLMQTAEMLREELRGHKGIVGRLGGDEFVLIVESLPKVGAVREQLYARLRDERFLVDPDLEPIELSFSVGVASTAEHPNSRLEDLLHAADLNMYYHKYQNRSPLLTTPTERIPCERGQQLLHVLAEKDMYTYVHSQYVAEYAADLAHALKLPERVIEEVRIAGWLHDVGKILISNDILRKPVRLTPEEYETVKRHVLDGVNILHDLHLSPICQNAILHHHERWDGLGYPRGIKGEDTPIEGRILQIADAFSAMSIKRVYRERSSLHLVLEELRQCSGVQFDPVLVSVFIDLINKQKQVS